jgi:hypothetical protein
LFIELPVKYMKIPSSEHGENLMRTCWEHVVYTNCFLFWHSEQFVYPWSPHVLSLEFSCAKLVNSMDNILSYCGLVNARISTSEKDLPVFQPIVQAIEYSSLTKCDHDPYYSRISN